MTESDAIKTIRKPYAQVWDLQEAAKLILGKYTALKASLKAARELGAATKKLLKDLNDRPR